MVIAETPQRTYSEQYLRSYPEFQRQITETFEDPQTRSSILFALFHIQQIHMDQFYEKNVPYTDHCVRVASKVLDAMKDKDPNLVIAALLHDGAEDQPEKVVRLYNPTSSYSEITVDSAVKSLGKRFGSDVEDMLSALTLDESNGALSYSQQIRERVLTNPRAAIIKLFDFEHNVSAIIPNMILQRKAAIFRAERYLPLFGDFINFCRDTDLIRDEDKSKIITNLLHTETLLKRYLLIARPLRRHASRN